MVHWIGETEVTYELWNIVTTWAIINGYTFSNSGHVGESNSGSELQPVTTINWRDAIVWCNAATEWYNAKKGTAYSCAYFSDEACTSPIRNSSDGSYGSSINSTAGSYDNPYIKSNANGFRLPTSMEWECAARYKGNDSSNGAYEYPVASGNWWTPGDYASGATADYADLNATGLVGWYYTPTQDTHVVKEKLANALGLYDISGNVFELCFDWDPSYIGAQRVIRGGSWCNTEDYSRVGAVFSEEPYFELFTMGLRIALTTSVINIDGLMAYYPFNGNADDESRFGNNGIVSGATLTTDRFGNTASAYHFDGVDDYINLGNPPILNLTEAVTISAWVKMDSVSTNASNWGSVFTKGATAYRLIFPGAVFAPFEYTWAFGIANNAAYHVHSNTQATTSWQHVVCTYDRAIMKIYLDGVMQTETYALNEAIDVNSSSIWIGNNSGFTDRCLKGSIDDIRIYNRALTGSEVQSLYHEGGW